MGPASQNTHPKASPHPNPSAASQLRQRQGGRPSSGHGLSDNVALPPPRLRRASTFSDTVSEARQSIKSSTDELFLPRADARVASRASNDESVWQSTPLALALLPALGGIFFQNGGAVMTDITLLVLAAVFLNWSVRLPWDWYQSAQGIAWSDPSGEHPSLDEISGVAAHGDDEADGAARSPQGAEEQRDTVLQNTSPDKIRVKDMSAKRELRYHELVALASCFIFPFIGAWLLHTIRSQLSRPSEGLVSNYNLTIFLLAAEFRPCSHLLKLMQARTLHLQRVVASDPSAVNETAQPNKIIDLSKRLDEIEALIAESKIQDAPEGGNQSLAAQSRGKEKELDPPSKARLVNEVRNLVKPDIEALNRTVRKYEKRNTTLSAELEARLQRLEARLQDAFAAPSYRPRKNTSGFDSIIFGPVQGIWAAVLLLTQFLREIVSMPGYGTSGPEHCDQHVLLVLLCTVSVAFATCAWLWIKRCRSLERNSYTQHSFSYY